VPLGFKFNLISIPCRHRNVWNTCLVGNENLKSRTKRLSRWPDILKLFSAHTVTHVIIAHFHFGNMCRLDVYSLLFLHLHYGETHRRLPKYAMTIGDRHHLVTLLPRSSLLILDRALPVASNVRSKLQRVSFCFDTGEKPRQTPWLWIIGHQPGVDINRLTVMFQSVYKSSFLYMLSFI